MGNVAGLVHRVVVLIIVEVDFLESSLVAQASRADIRGNDLLSPDSSRNQLVHRVVMVQRIGGGAIASKLVFVLGIHCFGVEESRNILP